jgi:hypothetical protein
MTLGTINDYTGVERFVAVEFEEVRAIVGDEGVFLLTDDSHELPIF